MNKICRLFENEFDGFVGKKVSKGGFDYTILKSGAPYQRGHFYAVQRLYKEYQNRLRSYVVFSKDERLDDDDREYTVLGLREDFKRRCESVCQNEKELCDILLDICYKRVATKHVVWELYSDVIIQNLLDKNGGMISGPVRDENGDIEFCGDRFSIITTRIEVDE